MTYLKYPVLLLFFSSLLLIGKNDAVTVVYVCFFGVATAAALFLLGYVGIRHVRHICEDKAISHVIEARISGEEALGDWHRLRRVFVGREDILWGREHYGALSDLNAAWEACIWPESSQSRMPSASKISAEMTSQEIDDGWVLESIDRPQDKDFADLLLEVWERQEALASIEETLPAPKPSLELRYALKPEPAPKPEKIRIRTKADLAKAFGLKSEDISAPKAS